jgi:carotenoid cleavage dioxygenase-like enzyme
VVFQNPVFVDNAPYLLGQAPAAACVRDVRGAPTVVHLVPRPGAPPGVEARSFLLPGFFVFHHANAFEEYSTDDSTKDLSCSAEASPTSVTIDSIHYDSMPAVGREALAAQRLDPDAAFRPRLRRLELDLLLGAVRARRSFDGYLEMPSVAPEYSGRRHRYVYGYHSVFEDPSVGVAKVDVGGGGGAELWLPGARRFALEPVFAPRARADGAEAAEDEGWLICQLWDAERSASEFIVLDAADLGAGPVAVVRLRAPLPSALHACWSESYYGPDVGGGGGAAAPVGAVAPSEAARLRGTRRAVAPGAAA